jgi:hypothetical protein
MEKSKAVNAHKYYPTISHIPQQHGYDNGLTTLA